MSQGRVIVIVGGAAGAYIATDIFANTYKDVHYLETYSEEIDKEKIISDKIQNGIAFINKKNVDYFIATGDNKQRKENFNIIYDKTKKLPVNCIHPTAYIAKSAKIGIGNLICPLSVIHTRAVIGDNTIINTGAIVEHDCLVNDYAQISPNVTLCGYVTVGEFSFIGAGSVIIPKVHVGRESMVGAGSSVIQDIADKKLYVGVPAKQIKEL